MDKKDLILKFKKIRDVKTPTRSWFDSWIDFYVPNNIDNLYEAEWCKFTPSQYISEDIQLSMKKNMFIIEENSI